MRSNLQIISDHYAASDRKDLPGMMADLADDVQWTEMAGFPCAGTYVGAPQIIDKVFKAIAAAWDGYSFTLQRLVDGGATITAIGDYRGTYRKTGKPMHARVVHVWQLEGGKVQSFEQFTDTLLVAQAMS